MLSYIFVGFAFFRIAYAIAVTKRQDITALSRAQIEEFKPYSSMLRRLTVTFQ